MNTELIISLTNMIAAKYQLKKLPNGQYFFRLIGVNNEVLLTSVHYVEKHSCETGIKLIMLNSQIDSSFVRQSIKSHSYFILQTATLQLLGISPIYQTEQQMEDNIEMVKLTALFADTADLTGE